MVSLGGAAQARRSECSLLRAHTALSSIALLPGKVLLSFYLTGRRGNIVLPCSGSMRLVGKIRVAI